MICAGGSCSPAVAWQADQFVLGNSTDTQYFTPPFTWHGFQCGPRNAGDA